MFSILMPPSQVWGVWQDRVYATPIYPIQGGELTIVHWEMINILIALRLWGSYWVHSSIDIFCDNLAVVQVVTTGKTRDAVLGACIRNIWLLAAVLDIDIKIKHMRGKKNVIADLLSRLFSNKLVDPSLLY